MAVNILSDRDVWREIAHDVIPGEDGQPDMYQVKPEAYAYVAMGALAVGMPDLNEKTAEEWLMRLRAWEIVDGPMLRDGDGNGVPVTMEALRPYFGTRTNVFPKETAAAFKRRIADAVMRRASETWRYDH